MHEATRRCGDAAMQPYHVTRHTPHHTPSHTPHYTVPLTRPKPVSVFPGMLPRLLARSRP